MSNMAGATVYQMCRVSVRREHGDLGSGKGLNASCWQVKFLRDDILYVML